MAAPQLLSSAELDAYFERIGFTGPRAATREVLAQIQRRHVCSVPFENLDIHLGRPIRIDLPSVFGKLVQDRRGGYCFEQNTLLRAVLLTLGFRVTSLVARVRWLVTEPEETAPTHMILRVDLDDGPWLADVGFGSGSLTSPLRLDLSEPQPTAHEPRRIVRRDDVHIQQTSMTGEWLDLYHFTLRPTPQADYEMGNWYTSTFPQSRFVANLVVARADEGLRYSILNREFTTRWTDGRVEKRPIHTPEELLALLARHFGLTFPAGTRFGRPGSAWPS